MAGLRPVPVPSSRDCRSGRLWRSVWEPTQTAAAVSASTRIIVSVAGERKLFASLAADTSRTGGWRRATRAMPAGIRASATWGSIATPRPAATNACMAR